MNIQLIKGSFDVKEATDIITQMIHVKIKFHENKISNMSNEEDIKFREGRIKQLQKDLYEAVNYFKEMKNKVELFSEIEIN
jgi:hypothetical protein